MIEIDGSNLVFILSTPRAGSTLLAALLGNHSQTYSPPEPWLLLPLRALFSPKAEIIDTYEHFLARIAWYSYMDDHIFDDAVRHFALSVYNTLLQKTGKSIFIDKTPRYFHILPWLEQIFPKAKKIWLRRNPLDVIASCKSTWGVSINEILGDPVSPITFDMTIGFSFLAKYFSENKETQYSLKYEDIVKDSTNAIVALCNFINVPVEPKMVNYGSNLGMKDIYTKASMGDKKVFCHANPHMDSVMRWRKTLTPDEVGSILMTLGRKIFVQHGYEHEFDDAISWSKLKKSRISENGNLEAIFNAYLTYTDGSKPNSLGKQQSLIAKDNARLRNLLSEAESNSIIHVSEAQRLEQLLGESEADRKARLADVQRLGQLLEESEADRKARLADVQRLGQLLEESEADRKVRLADVQRFGKLLEESEADRRARLADVQRLGQFLEESETDRNARLVDMQRLEKLLEESEIDRIARLEQIQRLNVSITKIEYENKKSINALEMEKVRLEEKIRDQAKSIHAFEYENELIKEQLNVAQTLGYKLEQSRIYRILRKFKKWEWVEILLSSFRGTSQMSALKQKNRCIKKVAVDLVPLLSGGKNGGAKILAIEVVGSLAKNVPECEWILLTSSNNHNELSFLDSPNVRRVCAEDSGKEKLTRRTSVYGWQATFRFVLIKVLPKPIFYKIKTIYRKIAVQRQGLLQIPDALDIDLLFCPFTGTKFFNPKIPMVSLVHDLQYLFYPHFFSRDDRFFRDRDFRNASSSATRIICVSDYVRSSVLQNSQLGKEQVVTVYTRLYSRLSSNFEMNSEAVMLKYKLCTEKFLLYPANFWQHKNHKMLLSAFGIYNKRYPNSEIKLVFTGEFVPGGSEIQHAIEKMGLIDKVIITGYVSNEELAVLMKNCRCLIFPSLYEGFGMPILEAFSFGKPVLCSRVASLPEIASDAAVYFDPRNPLEIVSAISKVVEDDNLAWRVGKSGIERLQEFGDQNQMAQEYWKVLQDAFNAEQYFLNSISGIYSDGWCSNLLTVTFSEHYGQRRLEFEFFLPDWFPFPSVSISWVDNQQLRHILANVMRGNMEKIGINLPAKTGVVEVLLTPVVQPKELGLNEDERWLGCQCLGCRIVSKDEVNILWPR